MRDVSLTHVSLAVVRTTTVLGFNRQCDHVVNVVGCEDDSAESVILLRKLLSAACGSLLIVETTVLKDRVTRETSNNVGVVGIVCIAWTR